MESETFRLGFRQGTGIGATKNPHRRTISPEPDLTVLSDREDLLERAQCGLRLPQGVRERAWTGSRLPNSRF